MVVRLQPRSITVDRGSRGFGLSLIYRGLDKYEEKDTGIFVARVVPGGQAARFGVRENDKIMTINGKTPRNVDDAVAVIKQAGNQIKLVVLREEDVPDISVTQEEQEQQHQQHQDQEQNWLGQQPISRSGSARSFNTTFGRPAATPSPRPQRAFGGQQQTPQSGPHSLGGGHLSSSAVAPPSPSPHQQGRQQDFLRQQEEYRRQQQQQQQQQHHPDSVQDTVRNIIANTDFRDFEVSRPRSPGALSAGAALTSGGRRVIQNGHPQETMKSTENVKTIVESFHRPGTGQSNKYKSTGSLHELGIDNYPNPEYPQSSRMSRKEEKQSLQNLNNRLASYIDRVRQLQNENNKLTHQIRTVEEYQSREVNNVKDLYDKQIAELKEALDNMNKQYNQLKVGAEGLLQENEELKDKLAKKDRDLANSTNHVEALEEEIRNISNKMSKLEQERQKAQEELKDALPEMDQLRKKLAELKRVLDDEQLKKADLENQCSRLEEDLKFKLQVLEKELTEVKTRKEIEIHEMDGKLQEEYEDRLQQALEELRGVYDKQMEQNREDFAKLYDDRMRDLQTQLTNERGSNASALTELKESRARIDALVRKISDLESNNLALQQKLADLAQNNDDLKSAHRAQMAAKDGEIKRLLDQLAEQLKEYQNLQDLKVQLDMEIAVFRQLLESEEGRLGIGDRSMDNSDASEPHMKHVQERKSESTFQRKITVSQTQL